MNSVLLVPLYLDALVLPTEQAVAQAMTDFSRLPYSNGQHDINADVANVSEEIVRQPFAQSTLKAGVHLHWALPDSLTRGTQVGTTTNFPSVPNRWLVLRARGGGNTPLQIEEQWIVESDYLYPAGQFASSVTTPVAAEGNQQPFRYLGRRMPFSIWQEHDPQAEYLAQLTAVGYGEPTFAAFYPNCYSVSGFYDDSYTDDVPSDLQYLVLGWYNDINQDVVHSLVNSLQGSSNTDLSAALLAQLGWAVNVPDGSDFPDALCCYCQIQLSNPAAASTPSSPLQIAVGNTGTEALSAFLANTLNPSQPAAIEDHLEAVLMASFLDQQYLDVGASFLAARHEKSFNAIPSGSLWSVRPQSTSGSADSANATVLVNLPESLAHQLNQLNSLQHDYDRALELIEQQREQLFFDWYKYMLAAYPPAESRDDFPDVDLVRYFVEQKDLVPLANLLNSAGALSLQWDEVGNVIAASAGNSASNAIASGLAQQINLVLQAVADFNASTEVQAINQQYLLLITGGPRYWQPNEPVLLLSGAALEPTDRHGSDGELACQYVANLSLHPMTTSVVEQLANAVAAIKANATPQQVGFFSYDQVPWNPILLEWGVEVFPLDHHSNLDPNTSAYNPDFIFSNYSLSENAVDLAILPSQVAIAQSANLYSGWSILSSRAETQYQQQLNSYLAQYPDDTTVQQAAALVNDPTFHCLAQSLGGFNQALLMRKQTYQLAMADPLGFSDYQAWTDQVASAVANHNRSAPRMFSDFNPIRSGAMRLNRLRLVDSFGQLRDVAAEQIIRTQQMTTAGSDYLIWLPPRLMQPARVNLRWLSANQGDMEMNDAPITTPICGWVVPNNLDGSLMIYATSGAALGFIDAQVRWQYVPGGPNVEPTAIENRYLRQMVQYVLQRTSDFLRDFIVTIDNALDTIDPENAAAHTDLALLLGRPIALVRTSLDLELQGAPAIHQSWSALRLDLQQASRDDDGFAEVEFPIRIGEYQQLNDGVVGYWQELSDGSYADNIFYAPQSSDLPVDDPLIRTHDQADMAIRQTVNAAPRYLTMLFDPRGSVHATSGIQPVKAITIPADQYADALGAIAITFLTAPILTNQGAINLPLPVEAGYRWSWLEQPTSEWQETSEIGQVSPKATFEAPQTLHDGWLKLSPTNEN